MADLKWRCMLLSVVIPAFDEEAYLPQTLGNLFDAKRTCTCPLEILVVDNDSRDATARIASEWGVEVIVEKVHNIALVRNRGAARARGDVLVFVDADTRVPSDFLSRVAEGMTDERCHGGAAEVIHRPASAILRLYFRAWKALGKLFGMAQGAALFCRHDSFVALGGFDESLYMGEDTDFYWRLKAHARNQGGHVQMLKGVHAIPSTRRFDQWPLWRTLVYTNPLFIGFLRKRASAWREWYEQAPR